MSRGETERILVVRVSLGDVHYVGDLVDGAFVMRLFGDALTFVSSRDDGDEGLLASYENVEFRHPVLPGDFLAIGCSEISRSRLSRTIELTATRQGRSVPVEGRASASEAWDEAGEVIATAKARIVIPMSAVKRRKEMN